MSNQINTTLLELEALLKNINEGSGTASKIINDKDLYEKITKTLESVKSLMEDIEKILKNILSMFYNSFKNN